MKESKAGSKKTSTKKPAAKASKSPSTKGVKSAAASTSNSPARPAATPEKAAASNPEPSKQPAAATPPPAPQPPAVDKEPQLPTNHGKVSVFGGPKDRGIKPDDKLALPTGPHGVYERVRSLNPKSFYCAMRWNYHVEHLTPEEVKRWWANKKLLLTNGKNGTSVVLRAVDYGPHENT